MGLITKLFGTRSERELKKIQPTVDKILSLEEEYKALWEREWNRVEKFKEVKGETGKKNEVRQLTFFEIPVSHVVTASTSLRALPFFSALAINKG